MRRILLATLAIALASACAAPGYRGKLQSWVGKSNAELVDAFGEPGDVVVDKEGRSVFVYATVRTETKGGKSMTTRDPLTGQPITMSKPKQVETYWCKTSFTLGEDDRVVSFAYEGNDCESR